MNIGMCISPWLSMGGQCCGLETVVSNLINELVKKGYKVKVYAAGGSKTSGELISILDHPLVDDGVNWDETGYHQLANASRAFEALKTGEIDILHLHVTDPWPLVYIRFVNAPVVTTVHTTLGISPDDSAQKLFAYEFFNARDANFISVSNSQRKHSKIKLNWTDTVYNGIDIGKYDFNPYPQKTMIWLSAIDPTKGILAAIEVAEKLDMPLKLAGRILPHNMPFFESEIRPRLSEKIVYAGEISEEEKSEFLGSGMVFLALGERHEPFMTVPLEAMATGTPIIGLDRGAICEVVKNGVHGFVVDDVQEACQAVKKISLIQRKDCRNLIVEKFSAARMAEGYLRIYEKLLKKLSNKHLR